MSPIEQLEAQWKKLPPSEKGAISISTVILVAAVILALFLRSVGIAESAAIIAILIIPLIVYGIASGRVQEFTGPGGWGATFREAANANVTPSPITESIQNVAIVEKGGLKALKEAGQLLEKNKPVALTLVLGRPGYYVKNVIMAYINTLSVVDPGMTVVLVDSEEKFVAMAEATSVLRTLDREPMASALIRAIGEDDRNFLRAEGFVEQRINEGASNIDALDLMEAQNLHTIVVVDRDLRPIGIVRRDDIVARLLLTLASTTRG